MKRTPFPGRKEDDGMGKYIEHVNTYLSAMKIKQNFVSFKTGIEPSKLSRLLTGGQDITSSDMEKIAEALGQRVEFFLADDFVVPEPYSDREMVFYTGELGAEQEEFAGKLMKFFENADEVLGAEERLRMAVEDQFYDI